MFVMWDRTRKLAFWAELVQIRIYIIAILLTSGIERHVHRGDSEKLKRQIEMVLDQFQQGGFEELYLSTTRTASGCGWQFRVLSVQATKSTVTD